MMLVENGMHLIKYISGHSSKDVKTLSGSYRCQTPTSFQGW